MTFVYQHPEFKEEQQRVKNTVAAVEQFIQEKEAEPWTGADDWATFCLQPYKRVMLERYQSVASNPYFARIDFAENGETNKYYIGNSGVNLGKYEIIDWRAPISALFYGSNAMHQGYKAPVGEISGQLLLKRRIDIINQTIINLLDIVDHRNGEVIIGEEINERYLAKELSKRGDPKLQEIVRTIQAQQDKIIRARHDQIVILNGVAGSGKTSIAYHRLAYLLFPGNQTGIKEQNTLILAPNRLFLSFTKSLLPEVGVDAKVAQHAVDDWMLLRMGFAVEKEDGIKRKFRISEYALDILANPKTPREVRIAHWKRARIKGSVKFVQLLERYAQFLLSQYFLPEEGWKYEQAEDLRITLSLSQEQIKEVLEKNIREKQVYREARYSALSELKQFINAQYESAVQNRFETILQRAKENKENFEKERIERIVAQATQYHRRALQIPSYRTQLISKAESQLEKNFNEIWPEIDVREIYYKLLSDQTSLNELVSGLLKEDEIKLLLEAPSPLADTVDLEDIAGIFYLHLLLRGDPSTQYDHIVVDEAQDLSPLQYHLLKKYTKNNSMTIVGDISQGIYGHRGITTWDEVKEILGEQEHHLEEITQNYRSTAENVTFSNQVLKEVFKNKALLAKPFERHGTKPKIMLCKTTDGMYRAIVKDVNALRAQNISNIGIIVKTESLCDEATYHLNRAGLTSLKTIIQRDENYDYEGGTIIIPVALAKGLEFQAVLIPDANEEIYDSRLEYDGRLFYVAITRALHHLLVYSSGTPTKFLQTAKQSSIILHGG